MIVYRNLREEWILLRLLVEEWSIEVYFECSIGDNVLWDFIGLSSSFATIQHETSHPILKCMCRTTFSVSTGSASSSICSSSRECWVRIEMAL